MDERVAQLNNYNNFEEITEEVKDDGVVREYAAKYAIIYANEHYEKLQTIEPRMIDLKWTKTDLMNARPTVEMFGIPRENVIELVDCSYDQLMNAHKELKDKIQKHAEK